jgi:hypothetical protein
MFYRLVNKNSLLPFVLLPFMVILLWGKTLFFAETPIIGSSDGEMPLYALISPFINGNRLTASLVGLFIAFLVSIGLNRFNANFLLLKKQTVAAGYLFLIAVSAFTDVQIFQPIWIFLLFFTLATYRLFLAPMKKDATVELFDAAFLVSTSALFFPKALFFIPLLFWVAGLFNLMSFRGFCALLVGIVLPLLIALAISFLLGQANDLIFAAKENLLNTAASYNHSWLSYSYLGLMVGYILLSLVMVIGRLNTMKILNRKYFRAFMAITLYGIMLASTPFFSIEVFPIIAFGAAYLLAQFLDTFKSSFWVEVTFGVMVLMTLMVQLSH